MRAPAVLRTGSWGASLRAAVALATLAVSGWLGPGQPPLVQVAHAAAPLNWEYKSFTLAPFSASELFNSGPALQQLADAGANTVTFVPTWYTSSEFVSDIFATGATASDASLVSAIQKARSLGLKVILKPHLDVQNGMWRAHINPPNPDTWFANYAGLINHYADLAAAQGATALCIGAELISMSTNPAYEGRWRSLIAGVRQRFAGKLTYSANWGAGPFSEEFTRIPFWDALDYLGISAYFTLAGSAKPTVAQLEASWTNWQTTKILPYQQQVGKPLMFTEVGYRSADGAAMRPWDASDALAFDGQEQADLYQALFESWAPKSAFAGAAFWFWSTNTGLSPTDTDYPVQNKPAQATVSAWFHATASPSFKTTASVAPSSVSPGGTVAITAAVASATPATALVDLEVHDASGAKLFQQVFDNQSFAAGQARSYSAAWPVPATARAGTYTVAVGVFAPGWASVYQWNGQAAQVSVAATRPSFTTTATVAPRTVARGQTTTITVSVTSATSTSVLLDVEVQDAANAKVFQQFVDNQSLTGGQRRDFAVPWPVPASTPVGSYRVHVGIFSPGWAQLLEWNPALAEVIVQ